MTTRKGQPTGIPSTMEEVLEMETIQKAGDTQAGEGGIGKIGETDLAKLIKEINESAQVQEVIEKYDKLLLKQGKEYSAEILDFKEKLREKNKSNFHLKVALGACVAVIVLIALVAIAGVFM
jgi:hypothetical protein